MYMIVKKYDRTANVAPDKALSYYGFCTCGHHFVLPRMEGQDEVCYNGNWFKAFDTSLRCPKCGAEFGHRYFSCGIGYNGKFYAEYGNRAKAPMFSMKADGDMVSILREDPEGNWGDIVEAGKAFTPLQTTVEFDLSRGLRPVRIIANGKELRLTASAMAKAFVGINANDISVDEEPARFREELIWMQKSCGQTSSLGVVMKNLMNYPVLDSLYEYYQSRQTPHVPFFFLHSAKDKLLERGERSLRKALGLPAPLVELVCYDKVSVKIAKLLSAKYGKDLATECIAMACNILPSQSRVGELAEFLAEHTPAERKRLKAYLTEEVCIYQGIENAGAAWELLRDYINMSKKMGVEFELCPKSLKLRHDLAARNQRLIAQEQERADFAAKVQEPDYARLAWTSKDRRWAVVIPETIADLVHEGAALSHCVGSYAEYVINGTKKICFLRKTEALDKPLLTLTVNRENCCSTYLGFDNRYATKEEVGALKEWTKARSLGLEEYAHV